MAHRKGKAETPKFIKVIIWVIIGVIVLSLTSVVLYRWTKSDGKTGKTTAAALQPRLAEYPICAEEATATHELTKKSPRREIALHESCWSGWIKLPPATHFRIKNPGRLSLLTWNGRHLNFAADETRWLGRIAFANFRLRGEGTAIVYIE